MFFDRLKSLVSSENNSPSSSIQAPKAPEGRILEFVQYPHFRGFKRLRLTTYDFDSITKSLEELRIPNPQYEGDSSLSKYIFDFTNRSIVLKEIFNGNQSILLVLVDGSYHVGTFFPHTDEEYNYYQAIFSPSLQAIHLRIEYVEQNILYTDEKGALKTIVEDRYKAYLFIKLT